MYEDLTIDFLLIWVYTKRLIIQRNYRNKNFFYKEHDMTKRQVAVFFSVIFGLTAICSSIPDSVSSWLRLLFIVVSANLAALAAD